MENHLSVYLAAVALVLQHAVAEDDLPKPFGIGIGPSYVGGMESDTNGTKIALEVYSQYRRYRKLTDQTANADYYKRYPSE